MVMQYFAQDEAAKLDPTLTVYQTLAGDSPIDMVPHIRTILGGFLFSGDDIEKPVRVLSGGERTRLAVARMLLRPANTLLLDEPTNHLDLDSKDVLLEALEDFGGTLIFVSHDRYFVDKLATKVIEIGRGDAVGLSGQLRRVPVEQEAARDAGAEPRRCRARRREARGARCDVRERSRRPEPTASAHRRVRSLGPRLAPEPRASDYEEKKKADAEARRARKEAEARQRRISRPRSPDRQGGGRDQGGRGPDGGPRVLREPRRVQAGHRPPPGPDVGGRGPDEQVGGAPGTRQKCNFWPDSVSPPSPAHSPKALKIGPFAMNPAGHTLCPVDLITMLSSDMAAKPIVAPEQEAPPSQAAEEPAPRPGTESCPDGFYRDMVWNLRNGVVAITRDGRVAVMNDDRLPRAGPEAARRATSAATSPRSSRTSPTCCRIMAGAFELSHLPNRAELRLKNTGKVIGYTLSHVKDARGRDVGATLFFKDLTRVEQLEERERLRDRLAALGEMAAAIAHEVKNPLAGIEVMAGLLKRQLTESPDAQNVLADIIKEAKMANVIVQEVLAFVRPIRLQVEDIAVADVIRDAIAMAESQRR